MKKSKITVQTARYIIDSILQKWLPLENGKERWKKVLILRTGLIAKTKSGKITYPYPIGITQKWLIDFFEGKKSPFTEVRFIANNISDLLNFAEFDQHAKDAACKLLGKIVDQGDVPPKLLLHFLCNSSKEKEPRKRGPHYSEQLFRNQAIIECFCTLEELGFFPMTKSSIDLGDDSACHLIAEALKCINIKIGYEALKNIRYQNIVKNKAPITD